MGLAALRQEDFSAGMWRSLAPHRIPQNGCWDLKDFLIDNQGLPYHRGGVEAFSEAGPSSSFTTVHDILTAVGRRTFWATETQMGVLDPTDGVTPVRVDPGGVFAGLPPARVTVIGGRAYFDYGAVYGGATQVISYGSVGSIAFTQGSSTITGSGGVDFAANLVPGAVLGIGTNPRNYVVKSITDATHLELTQPIKEASGSNGTFSFRSIGSAVLVAADIYGTAGRRLLASGGLLEGKDRVYFTRNQDPINEVTRTDGTFQGLDALPDEDPENFHEGDYHQIPGSAEVLGIESWGDTAVIFTTDGVWLISNMDLQPVDTSGYQQQQLVHRAPQVVLWNRQGLAKFEELLVVPGRDGIYLMGPDSLERIDTPITPLYRDYVRQAGYQPGLATVYQGHYFLPILDAAFNMVDFLVCRLDRPVRTSAGIIRPWVRFSSGAGTRALTIQESTTGSPNLLVAPAGDKLLRARYFEPAVTDSKDNGTTFLGSITLRDLPTGSGNKNVVREIDADYDLVDTAAPDNPTLIAEFATGHPAETASFTTLSEAGPEGTDQLKQWLLPDPPRTRYIRVRLRPAARLKSLLFRSVTVWVRQSMNND